MDAIKGQLTLRGVVIGCIGCAVITASSVYVALKMGALPWPIIFAAILSLFLLKWVSKGSSTLNEANVTHTVMSSGAMVAGGLAFTIPGAWMLGLADEVSWVQLAAIALGGSALGLLGSIALRRHFIDDVKLEYPIGEAAAQTLKAGDAGGSTGKMLFGSMGFAAVYTLLRDAVGVVPSMLCNLSIPGVAFGIYNSPMMLAVGFLVGTGAIVVWFAGAVLGNFGVIVGGSAAGLWSVEFGQQVASCLGMGCMMGCGIAVIVRDIIPKAAKSLSARMGRQMDESKNMCLKAQVVPNLEADACGDAAAARRRARGIGVGALVLACVAVATCLLLDLPFLVSLAVVVAAFVACAMSAQSVGQTGIDPMEIFGLIVLLCVAGIAQMAQVKLFFIAALVAVACGLAGDVMNDFKAGSVLGTNPTAQWVGQAIGGIVGSVVAVVVICVLLQAYGPDAFGVGKEFVSAQASVVATMVSGIPNLPAFLIGLGVGFVLYLLRFPSMMFGLGIYLPFYMSLTTFLGAMAKVVFDLVMKRRRASLDDEARQVAEERAEERGMIVASGLLGGESVMGIVLAMVVAGGALLA